MSPADLEALARELDGVRRAAESALATLVSRVEESGAYRSDGHRGVRAWGMAACNWSLPESARFVKAGHLLARFPSAHGLGVAQLHALAAMAANPRVQPHLDEAEALLVGQAQVLDFDDYSMVLREWEAAADPDGAHADHERAHREREASIAQVGVKTFLNAHGGAVHDRVRTRHARRDGAGRALGSARRARAGSRRQRDRAGEAGKQGRRH